MNKSKMIFGKQIFSTALMLLMLLLTGCGKSKKGFMYGCETKEEALESFWECVREEDEDLAEKISYTHYIRFEKSEREMLATPSWNQYLNIVGFEEYDSPRVTDKEIIGEFKAICGNPSDYLEYRDSDRGDTLRSYEELIYDLFGIECVIQASLYYDYGSVGVDIIEVDDRWFAVAASSWWDYYSYN